MRPPALDRVVAVFNYEGPVRGAVYSLKYDDLRAIAPRLAGLMADALPRSVAEGADALVPVPVSGKRLRSRGYNQSALLARHISRETGTLVMEALLRRVKDTPPQARAESEAERRQNVIGAFEASGQAAGMRVLLIDDVMTTGSTLNACAATLKNAGAKWVGALVLAREL
jgi:ComF family protein